MSVLTAAADLRLAPPRAWMWAFVGLALVNAVELAPLGAELAGWDRLVFHLYDAGHMVALGLVGRLIGWAWLRWGPRRHGDLALAVAGTVVFGPLLLGDASSFIARQAETGSVLFWKTLIAAAPGVAFFVILRAPHRRLRIAHRALAVAAGLMLQHINHHGLPSDYTGLHLLTTVLAASVIAVGVSHPAPKRKDQTPKRPQLKRAGLTLTSLGATATLLIHPGDATWRRLFASSGSGRRMKGIVFPDGYKVILDDARRTRELVQDPGETINLVDHPDEGGRDALRQTEAFFDHIELQRPGYEVPWRRF